MFLPWFIHLCEILKLERSIFTISSYSRQQAPRKTICSDTSTNGRKKGREGREGLSKISPTRNSNERLYSRSQIPRGKHGFSFSPRNGGAFVFYKSVFSRQGPNCLGLPERVLAGNSNGWVGHHGDDGNGMHFSQPNVTKRFRGSWLITFQPFVTC